MSSDDSPEIESIVTGPNPWTCPLCGMDLDSYQRPSHLLGHD